MTSETKSRPRRAAVIGAGFTGSACAYHWSKQDDGRTMAVLEMNEAASGASGRNEAPKGRVTSTASVTATTVAAKEGRFFGKYLKLDAGLAPASALAGTSIVQGSRGQKTSELAIGRQLIADQGVGMAAYAFHGFACHFHGASLRILVEIHTPPTGRSEFPLHGGELGFLAGSIHKPRIYPVGPITSIPVSCIACKEVQLLGSLKVDGNVDGLAGSGGGHCLAREESLALGRTW